MIRLIAALAASRDQVDRAIAFGEAIPRLERLKVVTLAGLVLACFVLSLAYISMSNQLSSVRADQRRAEAERALIIQAQKDGNADRARIMRLLAGKYGASTQTAP